MAFAKKEWKGRIVEFPGRRRLKGTGITDVYDIARNEGAITQEGDAFSAANMNDLEGRIEGGLLEKANKSDVLQTLEQISANTDSNKIAGAAALRELNNNCTATATLLNGCIGSLSLYKYGHIVIFKAMINDTAISNSYGWKNNLAELPVGYRPIADMDYAVMYDGNDVPIRLILRSTGIVGLWCGNQSGGTISGCGAYIIN